MTETTVSEPVYKAVERILDEHSAWIARPSPDVTKRIAFAATIAAHSAVEMASTAWCDEIAARVDVLGYDGQAAIEALPDLVKAVSYLVAWFDAETTGPDYGSQTRDTHPDGEAIWQRWWDEQHRLCANSHDTGRAVLSRIRKGGE